MVEPVRHRRTKGAETDMFEPKATASHLDSTCAVQRRRFPVGASPTRQPLRPEAIGAVMEVTKWLKPSVMRLRRAGSSRFRLTDRNLRSTSILHLRKPPVRAWLL